jgi:hypothetical protein
MGSLEDRLRRLERAEGGEPVWEPIPREEAYALDVIADLRRGGLLDDSTPIEEFERMMIDRGVAPPRARGYAQVRLRFREERLDEHRRRGGLTR